MNAPNPIVFYAKCRPRGIDAWPIAKKYSRVFLGYPPWRKDSPELGAEARSGFAKALVNIVNITDNEPCPHRYEKRGARAAVTHNRKLARQVCPGSFVLVPRPGEGVCHIGRINGPFDIEDEPEWATEYLESSQTYLESRDAKLADATPCSLLADVVQRWPVEKWHEVRFPLVPRWITYRLLSRNTCGIVYGFDQPKLDPFQCVEALIEGKSQSRDFAAQANAWIGAKLLELVSPSVFEHLVVHLLQLEAREGVCWHHVGGSGDGGVDGLAIDENGVVGALQCKWHLNTDAKTIFDNMAQKLPDCGLVVAALLGSTDQPPGLRPGWRFWGRNEIAELVLRHADKLPLARTLGISRPC